MATPPRTHISLPERYSVVRHVANGGMASVWEATDELLGRSVAVKVLSPSYAADESARRRFTREARAAARLSTHPHVVTVYDAGEHDGQAFMVMALYPGGTVADRIKAGPVPRALALDWLEDAAGALDLAHGEGVVHRDVKPANLLLDADDRVAVADFGIATAAWDTGMTSTGMVLGTLAYLAPEQRTGGTATPASDRYALGLVARELLTGARPGSEPTNPVALPGAAEVALMRATAEDPGARPVSCAALVSELEAALATGPTAAPGAPGPTAMTQAIPPPRPRNVAVPVPVPGGQEQGSARVKQRAPVAARTPTPARAASGGPTADRAGAPPRGANAGLRGEGRGAKVLVALALLALVVGIGGAIAASRGGDQPSTKPRTSASAKPRSRTATTKRDPTPKAAPAPAPASTPAKTAPAATKSRAALIAQNDRAYAATKGDPAGQIAPLQEAVDGLCTDTSDRNCAFALFNLAQALRLAGRPAEAIPLLQRRLSISDNQVGTVRQELAAAQQAAGVPAAAAPSNPKGKGKAKGAKGDG